LDYNAYDDKIQDVDEVSGTDVKINPDYYIHECLRNLQRALIKEDSRVGFLQFRMIAEHMEGLARSAGFLGDDYDKEIKTLNYEGSDVSAHMKLANKKVELITERVFGSKVNTSPMKA